MDIMELGAIGEFIGALAVIGSLLYVGYQIRQNARSTKASNYQATTDAFMQLNKEILREADVAELFVNGGADYRGPSDTEQIRFTFLFMMAFRVFQTTWYQSRQGTTEHELWESDEKNMLFVLSMPGVREWWDTTGFHFTDSFTSYVNGLLGRSVDSG